MINLNREHYERVYGFKENWIGATSQTNTNQTYNNNYAKHNQPSNKGWFFVSISDTTMESFKNSPSSYFAFPAGTVFTGNYLLNPTYSLEEDGSSKITFDRTSIATTILGHSSTNTPADGGMYVQDDLIMQTPAQKITHLMYMEMDPARDTNSSYSLLNSNGSTTSTSTKKWMMIDVGMPGEGKSITIGNTALQPGDQINLSTGEGALEYIVNPSGTVHSPYDI